jgi:hypothetical protein
MDFETGIEAAEITSSIPGLEFTTTFALDWRYADIRTGNYNVDPYGTQAYETNGNFFAWLGVEGDTGRITFTGGTASYLSVLVSTASGVQLDAYDADGNFLAGSGSAPDNTNTGTLTRLTVEADGMAYVDVHDTGNYWNIDDLCTDAPPPCQPLPGRTIGNNSDRLNLVFIADDDYGGTTTTFFNHVTHKIDNRLGGHAPITGNLDNFNFYYTELEGRHSGTYPGGNCGDESSLPPNFLTLCPEGDDFVVLHATNNLTDCNGSSGAKSIFSAEGAQDRSFIHEGGHGIFGLKDEYDSDREENSCTYTSYTGGGTPSNIFATEAACQTDAATNPWDADQCYEFTPCQGDWWKLGDASLETDDQKYADENFQFIMKDGDDFSKGWGDASERVITHAFDNLPVTPEAPLPSPSGEKAIVLKLNIFFSCAPICDGRVVLLDKSFVLGPAPKYRAGKYSLKAKMLHPSGLMFGEYGFDDPRMVRAEAGGSGPGSYMRESADFTLILPYFDHVGSAEILDDTGALLLAVDLSDFATQVNASPTADAGPDQTEECAGPDGAQVTLDGSGSSDPDGDPLSYTWTGPFGTLTGYLIRPTLPLGTHTITLTVDDGLGGTAYDEVVVTVVDTTAPVLECNAPDTIVPPDAPVSFTVTATDTCDVSPSTGVSGFDCFKYAKKGKRIDKTESCVVGVLGDTVTILDSGGVGDLIRWTAGATDSSGNAAQTTCGVDVVNPGRGQP